MLIEKNKVELLDKLLNIELSKYIRPGEVNIGKHGRISRCFNDILGEVSNRTNSMFTIKPYNQEYGICVNNITQVNDHTKNYLITISESCETYSIDEIIYLEKPLIESRIKFDPSKI